MRSRRIEKISFSAEIDAKRAGRLGEGIPRVRLSHATKGVDMRLPTRLFIIAVLLLVSSVLAAQTDVEKQLTGTYVKKRITFTMDKDGVIYATVDDDNGTGTLSDGVTFRSPSEVELVYPNFNPFTTRIT